LFPSSRGRGIPGAPQAEGPEPSYLRCVSGSRSPKYKQRHTNGTRNSRGAVRHPFRFWLFFFTNLSKNPFHRGNRNRISIPGSSPQCSSGVVSDTSTQQRAGNGPRRGHWPSAARLSKHPIQDTVRRDARERHFNDVPLPASSSVCENGSCCSTHIWCDTFFDHAVSLLIRGSCQRW